TRVLGSVLDDETFLTFRFRRGLTMACRLPACAGGKNLQTAIPPYTMLKMHHIVTFLHLREINIKRGTTGNGVRRFQSARPLDLVPAKNFRVSDDGKFCIVAKKSPRKRTQMTHRRDRCVRRLIEAVFAPDFLEPLPLAFVIADHVHRVRLAKPAMQ